MLTVIRLALVLGLLGIAIAAASQPWPAPAPAPPHTDPGVYIPAHPGSDGDGRTYEPGSPAIRIDAPVGRTTWDALLIALILVIREVGSLYERKLSARATEVAAEQATRLALARIAADDESPGPSPGGILPTS